MNPSAPPTELPQGVHRDLGLSDGEFADIVGRLGRAPSFVELAMFSVMWSEHCSYKSSRPYLKSLPTEGPHILVGPGEGAGIVEVAPGVSVAWKIESHNHPSFVEPFNGAATGVGGIVRDILSMGARPIALMDPLRFGPLEDGRNRLLLEGVVHGISSYGNSIGVPTVGGETIFEDCYSTNPLVNVACLGVIEDEVMLGRAEGLGNKVILYGSATGRDGIGGASVLASATFDEDSGDKRPSVQVGDPFTEKLLIEASLELLREDLVVGLQDLGAGGISCPTSEMSAKVGTGMSLTIDAVHLREEAMEPFEIMISESQERMLAVVTPDKVRPVLDICAKWGLDANVVGEVTDTGRIVVEHRGQIVADVPAEALADGPVYQRASAPPADQARLNAADPGGAAPTDLRAAWLELLASPGIANKRWVWEQYDHMIFLGTVVGPGSDASVIRLPGREVSVAVSVDGPARFAYLDPYQGGLLAVAEAARNVACSGARPLAVTNCLNFGNPERPEVMWQFAEVVRGIGDACRALGTPVTGGNVSFYNETGDQAIYPTPVIGMLGAIPRAEDTVRMGIAAGDQPIYLLGETRVGDFGGSEYAKIINGVLAGRPPGLELGREKALIEFLVQAASRGLLTAAHDLADGGLAVGITEMAVAGGIGGRIELPPGEAHAVMFSESPSRAIVTCRAEEAPALEALASDTGTVCRRLGLTGGDDVELGVVSLTLPEAAEVLEMGLPRALSATI